MRKIERIFVHCTASPQTWGVRELEAEFKNKGWKNPGYHYVITTDGRIHQMLADEKVSNGVYGYNATSINVAYVGGVDKALKPVDNRTEEQKESLEGLLNMLKERYPGAAIMGHRDIWGSNPAKWQKACPCFNAMLEYKMI